MGKVNYNKIFAMQSKNEDRIRQLCPKAVHKSGIYCIYREQDGFRFAYVGLATKSLLSRIAQHLSGYSTHIDLSICKYGLYDAEKNPFGYKVSILCYCSASECNEKEQFYIKEMANNGWQMKNSTSGSQGVGKQGITENKPSKGYYDGVAYGITKTKRKVCEFFDKYLDFTIKGKINKIKERKYDEFKNWLGDKNGI